MSSVVEKFLRYIQYDTTSDPESESQPSTQKQFALLHLLAEELRALGLRDAAVDEYGYVMATLESNIEGPHSVPTVGYIAHVDTSPDAAGASIHPQIVSNYDGGDLLLNKELDLWLRPGQFPELTQYKGQTLITTDGTTLLGADDKAGVAEIMAALEYLQQHPELKHGTIKIGFTPDEEIGRGVVKFDEKRFGAQWAYTIDGGEIGELEYENFNAAAAKIHIQGCNVHPGYAKNKMRNALLMGMELNQLLPIAQRPELTEGYEGFFHIVGFKGTVEEATVQYVIRDHSMDLFNKKKELLTKAVEYMNQLYGEACFTLKLNDQYYNMRQKVEPHAHIIAQAIGAMEKAGVTPKVRPIRGGTDGALLSFRGLPCPNLFTGGHNFHGKFEYVPVESMEKATQVIINLMTQNF